jgi:hypothetical protein
MGEPRAGLWQRITGWDSRRVTPGAALVVALLILAGMTHGRFLDPTKNGMVMAWRVVQARHYEANLEAQNRQLQALYEYLQTPAGQELAARSEFQALKPGERVIVLSEAAEQTQAPGTVAKQVQDGLGKAGTKFLQDIHWEDFQQMLTVYGSRSQKPAQVAALPAETDKPAAPDKP